MVEETMAVSDDPLMRYTYGCSLVRQRRSLPSHQLCLKLVFLQNALQKGIRRFRWLSDIYGLVCVRAAYTIGPGDAIVAGCVPSRDARTVFARLSTL